MTAADLEKVMSEQGNIWAVVDPSEVIKCVLDYKDQPIETLKEQCDRLGQNFEFASSMGWKATTPRDRAASFISRNVGPPWHDDALYALVDAIWKP